MKDSKVETQESDNFKLPNGVEDEYGDRSTGQAKSSVGGDNGAFKLPGDLDDNQMAQ